MAFSGPSGSENWAGNGFSDWSNGGRDIVLHESSPEHKRAEIAQQQWRRGMTVTKMIDRNRSSVIEDNCKVMECALDCIRYLACEVIAIWGNTSSDGKFMSLFRLMAKRDSYAAAYLLKIEMEQEEKKKMSVNLISPGNIRLALATMKQLITATITQQVQQSKKACIIFDSTQDYSKKEASVLLLRYLDMDNDGECTVQDRVVEVFTTGETTGSVLTAE